MQYAISRGRRMAGFTLLELMATLAVASVLMGVGLPSIGSMSSSNQMSSHANQLLAHLAFARSEAVMLGKRTVLCPSSDGASCSGNANWHEGWILFVDADGNRNPDNNDDILRVQGATSQQTTIRSSLYRKHIVYQANGMSLGSNATFTLCAVNHKAPPRAVIIANTGRTRLAKTRPDGSPLLCNS